MNGRMWSATAVAGLVAGLGLYAAPASAQATSGGLTRTFVSGVSTATDGNPCTRTAPCKTLQGALTNTAIGGEVNCLDASGFGTVTITNSVSIVCDNTVAGIMANTSGASGIVINGAAGAVVTLVGLDLDGFSGTGTDGIQFNSGASLVLDNVKIRNFSGYGVRFAPTAAATLTVKKASLTGNGSTSTIASGGMYIHPAANVTVRATVSDAIFANNLNAGLRVDPMSGSVINATVLDTVVTNSGTALFFRALGNTGTINASVQGVTSTHNNFGLFANGATTTVGVSDATIVQNTTGVSAIGGSTVSSFGDNKLFGNSTNGSFTASMTAQ